MNILAKSILLSCWLAATGSSAQGVGALVATPSAVDANAPLILPLVGTLFFDQRERERMNDARKRGEISFQGTPASDAPSVLDGFVKRSDGKSTVWVDGVQRTMSDARIIARVQSTSVGMETTTIIAGEQSTATIPSVETRATVPAKRQKSTRKADSASAPLRK